MRLPAPVDFAHLILGSHDLAEGNPSGTGGERDYWVAPEDFFALVETISAFSETGGYALQLTSDDGFASDHEVYLPWLIETGRTATFFVPTGFIDQPNRLTKAQLREMLSHGMAIGCHGVEHLRWTELNDRALEVEIASAKHRLEDMLGVPVTRVAPPFGAYDADVIRACVGAGFDEIYTTRGGYSLPAGRLRPRVTVTSEPVQQVDLLDLARRGPKATDRFACFAREVQAVMA